MGAWGSGPFENDDAADWSYQLTDGGGPEVVAAGVGVPGVELPDELSDWLGGVDPAAWPPLAPQAVAALDRVLSDSELRDLWDEADDGVWRDETLALRAGIAAST